MSPSHHTQRRSPWCQKIRRERQRETRSSKGRRHLFVSWFLLSTRFWTKLRTSSIIYLVSIHVNQTSTPKRLEVISPSQRSPLMDGVNKLLVCHGRSCWSLLFSVLLLVSSGLRQPWRYWANKPAALYDMKLVEA
ncbi:expressed unknown protein [Seminavis robusta]|uniref:Uncharacterized protein n=1 Tax=Seminavis robusta TaxID=568900 RepID=A0A9N8HEY9_9STRA|nr:expressed unknown protein [Seminavis robusta]|eukprot:Sro497_g154861.1  (135) ;mRNA; r:62570-62974